MQVIHASSYQRPIARGSLVKGFVVGAILFTGAIVLGYLIFGTPFLAQFMPSARPAPVEIVAGVAAWSFALTAPAGFGLAGVVRLATVLEQATARPRVPPAVRMAQHLGDQCVVVTRVRLPDGRVLPEVIVGPFGAAIVAELPPAAMTRRHGHTWEARTADGRWVPIEIPLDRAARDIERLRRWFGADDRDFVVKVHAAIVAPDTSLARTPQCAVITEEQLPAWLAALPAQRTLSPDRRERIVELLRTAS